MRTGNFGSKLNVAIFALWFILTASGTVTGDIGGGAGMVQTPYSPHEAISEEEVLIVKDAADRSRQVRGIELRDGNISESYEQVGLGFVRDGKLRSEPCYKFEGITDDGEGAEIDFSIVDSFYVIRFSKTLRLFPGDRALLVVVLFPDISVRNLLAIKPSYSELREKYMTSTRLWVKIRDKEMGELSFIGKVWRELPVDEYEIITEIRNIKLKSEIEFEHGFFRYESHMLPAIWWAIHSVTEEDTEYPDVAPAMRAPSSRGRGCMTLTFLGLTALIFSVFLVIKL